MLLCPTEVAQFSGPRVYKTKFWQIGVRENKSKSSKLGLPHGLTRNNANFLIAQLSKKDIKIGDRANFFALLGKKTLGL